MQKIYCINALDRRNVWRISESVFVSDETLDEVYDIWVVTLNDTMLSFLKLASSNPNLMAVLYYIDANGNLGNSSGWGVNANGSASPANIPPGQYAIVIGSTSGTETGTYTLMWNCSNPSKNAKRLLACSDDLTRIMVYYNDTENKTETILTSGEDILTNLTWQESETWVTSLGYSARDMVMKLTSAKGIYLGSLSTSEPYSVPNALFIEVNRGTWRYCNSYYENKAYQNTN